MVRVFERGLRGHGFEVTSVAPTTAAASAAADESVRIAVLDLPPGAPRTRKLVDTIRARRPGLPLLFLVVASQTDHPDDALQKPFAMEELIALALMSPQPLLALDEPFDGLDLHQTRAMMSILRNLRAQSRTLLLCIHQLVDAERICDRVLLLSQGRIIGVGTLDELRAATGLRNGSLEEIFLALT